MCVDEDLLFLTPICVLVGVASCVYAGVQKIVTAGALLRRCDECGYDLNGLSLDARCPECGSAVRVSTATARWSWEFARAVRLAGALLFLSSLPLLTSLMWFVFLSISGYRWTTAIAFSFSGAGRDTDDRAYVYCLVPAMSVGAAFVVRNLLSARVSVFLIRVLVLAVCIQTIGLVDDWLSDRRTLTPSGMVMTCLLAVPVAALSVLGSLVDARGRTLHRLSP